MPAGLNVAPHERQAPIVHDGADRRSALRFGTSITSTMPPQRSQTLAGSTKTAYTSADILSTAILLRSGNRQECRSQGLALARVCMTDFKET
jgi:hypothetical protein